MENNSVLPLNFVTATLGGRRSPEQLPAHSPSVAAVLVIAANGSGADEPESPVEPDGGFISDPHHQTPMAHMPALQLGGCVPDQRRTNAVCPEGGVHRNRRQLRAFPPRASDGVTGDPAPELGNQEKVRIPREILEKQWTIPSLRWEAKFLNLKNSRKIGLPELPDLDPAISQGSRTVAALNRVAQTRCRLPIAVPPGRCLPDTATSSPCPPAEFRHPPRLGPSVDGR